MFGTRRDLSYEVEKPNPGQLGLGSSRPESTRPGQLVCIVLYSTTSDLDKKDVMCYIF